MVLRYITNVVRWTWGYDSWKVPEKIDPGIAFVMINGALLDIVCLVGTVFLIRYLWKKYF